MKRNLVVFVLVFVLASVQQVLPQETHELYRIRIRNSILGAVEVSLDRGKHYTTVGRVTRPASATVNGFLASKYAESGKVCAVAVHGIRVKVGEIITPSGAVSQIISIVPREFEHVPKGFGGHVAGLSGIVTDIPVATAVFRNLAPFVGNRVLVERQGKLSRMWDGYVPQIGDVLVVVVEVPNRFPREIILENVVGGKVEAVYDDSSELVAIVERPVHGVGRFDATSYTGVGRINTNHVGVITVSTAPVSNGEREGSGRETRGGFMIQPNRHGRFASEIAQVMIVAPSNASRPALEGTAPLFSGNIGLAYDPESEENSFGVDIRCGDSEWEAMPALVGKHDDVFSRLLTNSKDVTAFRIRFPKFDASWFEEQVRKANESHIARVCSMEKPVSGRISLSIDSSSFPSKCFVGFYLDGECMGVANIPPYIFEIDTSKLSPGEHIAEIRAFDERGVTRKTLTQRFVTVERQKGKP